MLKQIIFFCFLLAGCNPPPQKCATSPKTEFWKDSILRMEGQVNSCTNDAVGELFLYRGTGSLKSISIFLDNGAEKTQRRKYVEIFLDSTGTIMFMQKQDKDSLLYNKIFNQEKFDAWRNAGMN